jgi:ABC-type transporter Mla subunit MlaD
MSSELSETPKAVIPYAPKAKNTEEVDQLDRAAHALLGLIDRAADTAELNLQHARDVAEKLADQLRAARDRIKQLEANVRYYQDRADRAEKWLSQISSEIEQKFARDGRRDTGARAG